MAAFSMTALMLELRRQDISRHALGWSLARALTLANPHALAEQKPLLRQVIADRGGCHSTFAHRVTDLV